MSEQPEGWLEADPAAMPAARLLAWTGGALQRSYQRAVAAHGLTSTALGLLGVLAAADGVSHREVCGRLGITPATLTPVVDVLARDGTVLRERDPVDRRIVRLTITASGRERLRTVHADVTARMRARLPEPPAEHAAAIRSYLLAVLDAVAPV